jgi:replication initiation and membrane attachment protein DnaB
MTKGQERKAVEYFKSVSPSQVLIHTSGEKAVSKMDLKTIEELKKIFHLPDDVINVLVQYIVLAGLTLNHPSVYKIATHWSRMGITDAEEAMGIVKKEHQKYKNLWMVNLANKKKMKTIDSIRAAAESSLTNDQLGKYVRDYFRE